MNRTEQRGFAFWTGIFLMVASFGVYPTYPTIALLPISVEAKIAGSVASWSLSWILFGVGSVLAGRAGRELLAAFFARRRESAVEGRDAENVADGTGV